KYDGAVPTYMVMVDLGVPPGFTVEAGGFAEVGGEKEVQRVRGAAGAGARYLGGGGPGGGGGVGGRAADDAPGRGRGAAGGGEERPGGCGGRGAAGGSGLTAGGDQRPGASPAAPDTILPAGGPPRTGGLCQALFVRGGRGRAHRGAVRAGQNGPGHNRPTTF